jgi:hypothetical protein
MAIEGEAILTRPAPAGIPGTYVRQQPHPALFTRMYQSTSRRT